jgi:hypothetical protein
MQVRNVSCDERSLRSLEMPRPATNVGGHILTASVAPESDRGEALVQRRDPSAERFDMLPDLRVLLALAFVEGRRSRKLQVSL